MAMLYIPGFSRHLAILRTMRMRSANGASAWERVRGTQCSAKLLGFGELCKYNCHYHEGTIASGTTRWSSGVWLGVDLKTGQHMLWDIKLEGIRHVRTLMRLPDLEKWRDLSVVSVALTPWSSHKDAVPEALFQVSRDPSRSYDPTPSRRHDVYWSFWGLIQPGNRFVSFVARLIN